MHKRKNRSEDTVTAISIQNPDAFTGKSRSIFPEYWKQIPQGSPSRPNRSRPTQQVMSPSPRLPFMDSFVDFQMEEGRRNDVPPVIKPRNLMSNQGQGSPAVPKTHSTISFEEAMTPPPKMTPTSNMKVSPSPSCLRKPRFTGTPITRRDRAISMDSSPSVVRFDMESMGVVGSDIQHEVYSPTGWESLFS